MTDVVSGQIRKVCGGFYDVAAGGQVISCRARGVFRQQGITPLAGDQVRAEILPDGTGYVLEILPRRNFLLRPPVANLDCLFLLCSTCRPAPNLRLLDHLMALAELRGMEPVPVFTKSDLADGTALAALYRAAGFSAVAVSLKDDADLVEIRGLLAGRLSAFCGNTGVGKSTLLNRLAPDLALPTGEISDKLGRGRHTTRHVEIFPIAGGFVADTPGFSSLELNETSSLTAENLAACFRDFAPYLDGCRFSDCVHAGDQGCRVAQAAADGKIAPSRYESYLALWEKVKEIKPWQKR
ncbi:MAG: ribosome small subunit-dependent GTPase A [Oscillospiraceae bacterium]|jgi:ribosome biogenesis GTPase|nr:ribosome small subunit-dependent GTPase A [Oscillospiraceae bacterium]